MTPTICYYNIQGLTPGLCNTYETTDIISTTWEHIGRIMNDIKEAPYLLACNVLPKSFIISPCLTKRSLCSKAYLLPFKMENIIELSSCIMKYTTPDCIFNTDSVLLCSF